MAPMTRAKNAEAGAEDPNPKQTIKSELHINAREDEDHCSTSVRSEDTETTLQDTANAAANVSAAPLDSIEPVDPRESAEVPSPTVLPESNGIRLRSGQPTEEDELKVADFLVTEDFGNRWASGSASDDVVVAAAIIIEMKQDPNYDAPVQKGRRL